MQMTDHEKQLFSSHVNTDAENDCWEWTGAQNKQGYGIVKLRGRVQLCHRVSYTNYFGELQPNIDILHRCDNKICVKPYHLYSGSDVDNQRDLYLHRERFRKLSLEEVKLIKRQLSKCSNKELAAAFNCSHTHISSIRHGHKWAWVEEE